MYVRTSRLSIIILSTCILPLASAALAFAQLPDGPGKDETTKVCGTCHPATTAASVRLTRDGWQTKIAEMVARGAMATDDELAAILDYLATHFLGEASTLINVNTATAVELESVLELLRRESAAFIEYREKVKGFKSLEDMKNIPGVPFKKIESKKDRITFGIKVD
jgi:competence ComEA-like helix-hairpin-helix protein